MAATPVTSALIFTLVALLAVVSAQQRPQQGSQQGIQQGSQQVFQQGSQQGFQQGSQQGSQQGQRGSQQDDLCFAMQTRNRVDRAFPPTVERFSYDLFKTLFQLSGGKSAISSPYSIWSVLTLAYFGSKGQTQREIEKTLSLQNKTHTLENWQALKYYLENGAGKAELGIANKGYFSNSLQLNPCLTEHIFDLERVDFKNTEATRRLINQYVSTQTRGKIPELITFLSPESRLALVNAIYFKGTWEVQFDKELTRPQEFLVPPGISSGVVQMMTRIHDARAGSAPGLGAKIIEMPYLDSNISMFLLLPDNPNAPISDLVARLNPESFATAVRGLPSSPIPVSVSLPRFKLTSRYERELIQALYNLGVQSLFDRSRADLSGFAEAVSPPLAVDTAIHQATVEVNEEGTVAAAATAFVDTRFGPQRTLELVFNRPFLFAIVDKPLRLPLFIGTVVSAADLEEL